MNIYVLYVLEHKTSKKMSACLSIYDDVEIERAIFKGRFYKTSFFYTSTSICPKPIVISSWNFYSTLRIHVHSYCLIIIFR